MGASTGHARSCPRAAIRLTTRLLASTPGCTEPRTDIQRLRPRVFTVEAVAIPPGTHGRGIATAAEVNTRVAADGNRLQTVPRKSGLGGDAERTARKPLRTSDWPQLHFTASLALTAFDVFPATSVAVRLKA